MRTLFIICIIIFSLYSCTFSGQRKANKRQESKVLVDSQFYSAAKSYYQEKLKECDIRDFKVYPQGFTAITYQNNVYRCYLVLIEYSIYENYAWIQTHYKRWCWDLENRKCYCYSEYSQRREPGEPYQGMMTSVGYCDVTEEEFAKSGFIILDSIIK